MLPKKDNGGINLVPSLHCYVVGTLLSAKSLCGGQSLKNSFGNHCSTTWHQLFKILLMMKWLVWTATS